MTYGAGTQEGARTLSRGHAQGSPQALPWPGSPPPRPARPTARHPGPRPRATRLPPPRRPGLCGSRAPPATWHSRTRQRGPGQCCSRPAPRSPPRRSRARPVPWPAAWAGGSAVSWATCLHTRLGGWPGASCPLKSLWLQSREVFVLFMAHAPRGSHMFRTDTGLLARDPGPERSQSLQWRSGAGWLTSPPPHTPARPSDWGGALEQGAEPGSRRAHLHWRAHPLCPGRRPAGRGLCPVGSGSPVERPASTGEAGDSGAAGGHTSFPSGCPAQATPTTAGWVNTGSQLQSPAAGCRAGARGCWVAAPKPQ